MVVVVSFTVVPVSRTAVVLKKLMDKGKKDGWLKFADELLFAALFWPVIIWGSFKLLTDLLHFPMTWYTLATTFVLAMYFAIKVEGKQ